MIPLWMFQRYAAFAVLYALALGLGIALGGLSVYAKSRLFPPVERFTVRYVEVPAPALARPPAPLVVPVQRNAGDGARELARR